MGLFYIVFFLISFAFSFLINALFLRFSTTLGIRDKKETVIRWASTSKPALGGISFFIIFLISLTTYSIFFKSQEILYNKTVAGLLGTVTIAFMMGLADDAYNTRPFLKLFVQILCGIILCYSGVIITLLPSMLLNYLLTIIWTVGIMNSINMLDNMDAIATIVSIFIFISAAVLIFISGNLNNIHFLILLGIIAALCGFLIFNWHPSKLYMGDTGSQVIGIILAAIGIIYFWNGAASSTTAHSPFRQIAMVAAAFILPIADTTIVVINRLLKKKSPFIGGKDHTTHNLFYKGITEKRIAIIFGTIGLLSLLVIYYIETSLASLGITEFLILMLYPGIIFLLLFMVTKIQKSIVINDALPSEPVPVPSNDTKSHVEKRLT